MYKSGLNPNSQWKLQKLSRLGQEKCSNYRDARFRITCRLTRWSNTVIHTGSKHQSHLFSSHIKFYVYLVKHGNRIQIYTKIHKNYSKTLDLLTANNDLFHLPPPQEITTHYTDCRTRERNQVQAPWIALRDQSKETKRGRKLQRRDERGNWINAVRWISKSYMLGFRRIHRKNIRFTHHGFR